MNIHEYVRQQESQYESDTVTIAGKEYNQKDRINQAELMSLGVYADDAGDPILGELMYDDQLSGYAEKEAQILDFDTKHLDLAPKKPTPEARWKSAIATNGTRDIMEKDKYGQFFNKWSRTYTKYGGVLSKNTADGPQVVSWHNVITDQTDILSGVIIEKHYYTPAELVKMRGVWDSDRIDEALMLAQEDKDNSSNGLQKKSDTQGQYIEVYEVHNVHDRDLMEDEDDIDEERTRMFVITGVNHSDNGERKDDPGIILFESEEKEHPYKYLARNPIDGIALGRGIYEENLPQQVSHNLLFNEELKFVAITNVIYAKTNKKEMPSSVAALEQLSVFKLNDNEYFELESAGGRSLPGITDLRTHIAGSIRNRTGQQEAITGEEGKAGKTLGLHKLQNIEGHTRFRPKRQDIGFHFEEMVRDWVLPKALKQIRSEGSLYTTFTDAQLLELDSVMTQKELNRTFTEMTLKGEVVTPEIYEAKLREIQTNLGRQGKKRFIEDLNEFLKDVEGDIRISFTDEEFSKGDFYDNRISFIQLYGPEHPWSQAMGRKMLDEAGVTPDEIALEEERAAQLPAQGSTSGVSLAGNEQEAPAQQI